MWFDHASRERSAGFFGTLLFVPLNHEEWIGEFSLITVVECEESMLSPSSTGTITILWMDKECAAHKPWWPRTWHRAKEFPQTTMQVSNILLYIISFTKNGALRKVTREYLQQAHKQCYKRKSGKMYIRPNSVESLLRFCFIAYCIPFHTKFNTAVLVCKIITTSSTV
jgi:hypothetical protein